MMEPQPPGSFRKPLSAMADTSAPKAPTDQFASDFCLYVLYQILSCYNKLLFSPRGNLTLCSIFVIYCIPQNKLLFTNYLGLYHYNIKKEKSTLIMIIIIYFKITTNTMIDYNKITITTIIYVIIHNQGIRGGFPQGPWALISKNYYG